ncbi:MAG TPA: carbon storage regulator [Gemmataceae bacterium]|jgi:carbon storage regulator
MLVLSRKGGQTIVVPQLGITLSILGIRGDRVRIGISAPAGITVHREEVWHRIEGSKTVEPAEKYRIETSKTVEPNEKSR